jgi:DNA-binding MarR family transcriptional regulator
MLVLWKVARRGTWRVTDLAGSLGIPFSTFTGVLDRLEVRGLLERLPDPGDRRGVLVRATPALHSLLNRVAADIERELDTALVGFSEEDYHRAVEALKALVGYLDGEEDKGHGEA